MRRPLYLAALLALCACQSTPLEREESPYYSPPAGGQLILHQDLTIPAGRASVYIQGSPVTVWQNVNSYHPHCIFEVRKVLDTPQLVKAGTFAIRAVQRENYSAAAPGLQQARLMFSDGGPSYLIYATVMRLESIDQPDVYRLTCQHWEVPPQMPHYLTIRQMRAALGSLFTLKFPETK